LAGLLLGSQGVAFAQQGAAAVLVEKVEIRQIADTRPVIAQVVGTVESEIATRTEGVIDDVLFDVGDRVSRGQELVRLDRTLVEIEYRSAEASLAAEQASVEAARAEVRLADQGLARQSRLKGSTAFSRGQFEDLGQTLAQKKSELVRAVAEVALAEAALARADYDLRNAVIRAPFDGVVIARSAQPGEYISVGNPVATMLDITRLEIEADMPVELVAGLAPGTVMDAMFDETTASRATVRVVLPVQNISTRTRVVRLTTDFSKMRESYLAAGKSVVLRVPVSAPREAPMVPKDALVQNQGRWTVFVVEDGKAVRRQVEIGTANRGRMEVLSGLTSDEIVVIRGNERLRTGQPVAPTLVEGGKAADGT